MPRLRAAGTSVTKKGSAPGLAVEHNRVDPLPSASWRTPPQTAAKESHAAQGATVDRSPARPARVIRARLVVTVSDDQGGRTGPMRLPGSGAGTWLRRTVRRPRHCHGRSPPSTQLGHGRTEHPVARRGFAHQTIEFAPDMRRDVRGGPRGRGRENVARPDPGPRAPPRLRAGAGRRAPTSDAASPPTSATPPPPPRLLRPDRRASANCPCRSNSSVHQGGSETSRRRSVSGCLRASGMQDQSSPPTERSRYHIESVASPHHECPCTSDSRPNSAPLEPPPPSTPPDARAGYRGNVRSRHRRQSAMAYRRRYRRRPARPTHAAQEHALLDSASDWKGQERRADRTCPSDRLSRNIQTKNTLTDDFKPGAKSTCPGSKIDAARTYLRLALRRPHREASDNEQDSEAAHDRQEGAHVGLAAAAEPTPVAGMYVDGIATTDCRVGFVRRRSRLVPAASSASSAGVRCCRRRRRSDVGSTEVGIDGLRLGEEIVERHAVDQVVLRPSASISARE